VTQRNFQRCPPPRPGDPRGSGENNGEGAQHPEAGGHCPV
jgi:hypothetical protein